MTTEVRRSPDAGALAATVATALLARLAEVQAGGHDPQVVLTGGTIAEAIHREVARLAPDAGVDFARVVFWFGDERFVAPDSEDRNALQAREAFLDAVGAERVHEVASTATAGSVDEAAAAYDASLRTLGNGRFDVVMLGVGPDGHVASLFPGFPQVGVTDALAVGVTGSPKPPPERVSLTLPALRNADAVWFLISGEGKAEAVARALGGPERGEPADVHETPAAGVQGEQETVWWIDEAAASAL
ncbi:6-phosphogluconolactonase [Nocardioides sp. ChNu-153]|uniref:6-phosphogluconolactonase n=1 Tax=unclassified Nocardioides TaxID=2615069 RepID=UPI0024065CC4|nr:MULTISPECIES: 6-phosphogluconolactonase [unclassified Nocardioides]MDF9715246.1 6-phosphogluconolactonase [Nocardioides sp. ChNu-99]MDN7122543.1 6-phosphogluconolactonase [Nocardioides sp. ChNu-153]